MYRDVKASWLFFELEKVYRKSESEQKVVQRFLSLDPLASEFASWSPYNYVLGNPIMFIDPDGRKAEDIIYNDSDGNEVYRVEAEGEDVIYQAAELNSTPLPQGYNEYANANAHKNTSGLDLANGQSGPSMNLIEYTLYGLFVGSSRSLELNGKNYRVARNGYVTNSVEGEDYIDFSPPIGGKVSPGSYSTAGFNTLKPGKFSGKSIPATKGKSRNFSKDTRTQINVIGKDTGCHTCGSKTPGTKSGNFVPDHQPANAIVPNGTPQKLYPHCINCSKSQGGTISGMKRRGEID